MTTEALELEEAVAKAICDSQFPGDKDASDKAWRQYRLDYASDARAALAVVREKMPVAAWQARVQNDDGSWSDWVNVHETIVQTYKSWNLATIETRPLTAASPLGGDT